MAEPNAWLSVADVSEELTLNQQTVRNMIDRGDLMAYKVGRRVRVRRSDLDEFLTRTPIEPKLPPLAEPRPTRSAEESAAR